MALAMDKISSFLMYFTMDVNQVSKGHSRHGQLDLLIWIFYKTVCVKYGIDYTMPFTVN
jgi:hypothetical protein